MSVLAGSQTRSYRYQTPFLAGGLVTISFLLLAFSIVICRRSEPSLAILETSSLTALAIFLTGFLISVKYVIENLAVDRNTQQLSTWLLTLTHLLGSLALALTASSFIVGAFPIMFALTAECMKRTFAGGSFLANLPVHAHTLAANNALRLPSEFSLLAIDEEDLEAENDEEIEEDFASDCTQRISRFRVDTGEALSGQVRTAFSSGEKTKAIHVAFCPPFADLPTAEVFQIAGPAASIKQTLVEKFGMRLEVKLTGFPDGNTIGLESGHQAPKDVIVEFLVESKKACA